MALAPVFNLAADGRTVTVATSLAAGSYNLQLIATQAGAGGSPLTVNIPITVQASLPGSPTALTRVGMTSNSVLISVSPPTSGGALDNGRYQVQWSTSGSYTNNGPTIPYCTPSSGSVTDQYNNVWTIVPSAGGQPNAVMVNGVWTGGWNSPQVVLVPPSIWHVNAGGQWYSYTPSGGLGSNGGSVTWTGPTTTSPLASINVPGLSPSTAYTLRVNVSNSAGISAPSAVISFTTPAQGAATTAPTQAQAVGYTMLTQGPNVTIGQNIFVVSPGVVQNPDGSIRDNGPSDGNYRYNYHFGPGYTQGNGEWFGVAFGRGGYFEIDMRIEGNIIGWRLPVQSGWPAWWSEALQGSANGFPNTMPYDQHVEYDAAEFLPASNHDYSAGIIHWSDWYPQNNAGSADQFNNNSIGWDSNVNIGSRDFTTRHKYGWLWVPATSTTQGYIKNYFDNVQVGRTYTWTPYISGDKAQDPGDPPWSVIDQHHRRLLIGTNLENPMTVYSISVWQATDANNIRRGVPLPSQ